MTTMLTPDVLNDILQDDLALSLARALAVANKQACDMGIDTQQSSVSVKRHELKQGFVWRVDYGRLNPVGWRGGGLTVDVDPQDATVKRVLRGQ